MKESEESGLKVLALDLYPALYKSIGYVSFLKEIDEKEIDVQIFSASGFSAIVAALYIKYENANRVEWKIFSLIRLLKGEKVYSSGWKKIISNFLHDEFGDMKLVELNKLLIIPQAKNNRVSFNFHLTVKRAVLNSLNLKSRNSNSILLSHNFKYEQAIKKLGADIIFRVSALVKRPLFKQGDDFIFGVYSKLAGNMLMESLKFNLINEDNEFYYIDHVENLTDELSKVDNSVKQLVLKLKTAYE